MSSVVPVHTEGAQTCLASVWVFQRFPLIWLILDPEKHGVEEGRAQWRGGCMVCVLPLPDSLYVCILLNEHKYIAYFKIYNEAK